MFGRKSAKPVEPIQVPDIDELRAIWDKALKAAEAFNAAMADVHAARIRFRYEPYGSERGMPVITLSEPEFILRVSVNG